MQNVEDAEIEEQGPRLENTNIYQTHFIQIRLDTMGPVRKDGRRGRILLEGHAPPEVSKWLKSPECKRASKQSGKPIYVWIDDKMIPDISPDFANDADDVEETSLANLPINAAEMKSATAYQQRVEDLTKAMEAQLTSARLAYHDEVKRLRESLSAETAVCDALIDAARSRVVVEREREDNEMEALAERRRATAAERTAMVEDLKTDQATFTDLRKSMKSVTDSASIVDSISSGVVKIAQGASGTPVETLIEAVSKLIMSKVPPTAPSV